MLRPLTSAGVEEGGGGRGVYKQPRTQATSFHIFLLYQLYMARLLDICTGTLARWFPFPKTSSRRLSLLYLSVSPWRIIKVESSPHGHLCFIPDGYLSYIALWDFSISFYESFHELFWSPSAVYILVHTMNICRSWAVFVPYQAAHAGIYLVSSNAEWWRS